MSSAAGPFPGLPGGGGRDPARFDPVHLMRRLLWASSSCRPDDERVCRACVRASWPVVELGQVWANMDERCEGQLLEVVAIAGGDAVCAVLTPSAGRSSWPVG